MPDFEWALIKTTGLGVILVPIGRAAQHEDDRALARIRAHLPGSADVSLLESAGIYDIMGAIASSRCFVGTSLHGVITALSFGVPHVGLRRTFPKVAAWMETWSPAELPRDVHVAAFAARTEAALACPAAVLEAARARAIERYLEVFADMLTRFPVDEHAHAGS